MEPTPLNPQPQIRVPNSQNLILKPKPIPARWSTKASLPLSSRVFRDPNCTTYGPQINWMRHVNFWCKGDKTPCGESNRKRFSTWKLSGDEVYYTSCYFLVLLKHSCGKLRCHKGFDVILFSYKIRCRTRNARCWSVSARSTAPRGTARFPPARGPQIYMYTYMYTFIDTY